MKRTNRLILPTLVLGLTVACGDDHSKKDLQKKNNDLASQNAALQQSLAAAKADLVKALADETALSSGAGGNSTTGAGGNSTTAATELPLTDAELKAQLRELLNSSLAPYSGIWVMDTTPANDCQVLIRFDANEGSIYRTVVCGMNVQAELQSLKTFAANNGGGWSGSVGVTMTGESLKNSCGTKKSFLASGVSYSFDHSVGTATASTEASLFMTSNVGTDVKNFKSGSTDPDFGKNKSCDQIVTRAAQAAQKDNLPLQQAALVCKLTPAMIGAGCFTAPDQFVNAQ
ncbi:MAG: hypothetical protein H7249_08320 [Chitinophagaceae bacterium]|nr:hypothetical protein [Oligoflexus sp.]